ncbi:MAG: hypothetical protein AAGI66_02905 [Cyanobacteria bacterium P01_H01_bin.74]
MVEPTQPYCFLIPKQTTIDLNTLRKMQDSEYASLPALFFQGKYLWALRTYLILRDYLPNPADLLLDDTVCRNAINIAHADTWRSIEKSQIGPETVVVSADADKPKLLWADYNISQAPIFDGPSQFNISHWAQPNVIARNAQRMNVIKKVAYFGELRKGEQSIHTLLEKKLSGLNIAYEVKQDFVSQNDYSDVDIAVALRFNWHLVKDRKPASKLFNAAIAGIPLIATPERSYLEYREMGLCFLPAYNVTETINIIEHLAQHPDDYESLLQNAQKQSTVFEEKTATAWLNVLRHIRFTENLVPEKRHRVIRRKRWISTDKLYCTGDNLRIKLLTYLSVIFGILCMTANYRWKSYVSC